MIRVFLFKIMGKFKKGEMFIKSVKVDGIELHTGADLFYLDDSENSTIHLKTEIGRSKKQIIEIILTKDDTKVIVNEDKTSSDWC